MLTVNDVARRLRVSPSTVYNLVEGGHISCHRIGRGRGAIRFTEEQVQEFMHTCEVKSGSLPATARFSHGRK
jgi:excisionase family DNA binding protein